MTEDAYSVRPYEAWEAEAVLAIVAAMRASYRITAKQALNFRRFVKANTRKVTKS